MIYRIKATEQELEQIAVLASEHDRLADISRDPFEIGKLGERNAFVFRSPDGSMLVEMGTAGALLRAGYILGLRTKRERKAAIKES